MKSVIIIAIALVLLIPTTIFAQNESIDEIETKYNACIERANRIVIELLKQQSSQGSIIGYEGKFQKQEYENCMSSYLIPLLDTGNKIGMDKKYAEAMSYFDKVLELSYSEILDGKAYLAKAIIYQNLKEYDSALENYNKVLEIEPTHSQALENMALIPNQEAKQPEPVPEPEPLEEVELVCGKGTVLIDYICQVDEIEEKREYTLEDELSIPREKLNAVEEPVDIPVEKPFKKSEIWFYSFFDWLGGLFQ